MRRTMLRAGWTAALAALALAWAGCDPPTEAAARPGLESDLFERANRARVDAGRTPLRRDAALDRVAQRYAAELAARGKLDHVGQRGDRLADRVRAANVSWLEIGENLARNQNPKDPVGTALEGWDQSPGHRRHLYNARFLRTGVGVVHDPESRFTYLVQLYLLPP